MRELHRVLNIPEYVLLMSQYAWICVNDAEYDLIRRHIPEKTRVQNAPEFWMCVMQKITRDHSTNYWAVIETEVYWEHCVTFEMKYFVKRIMPECRCAIKIFLGQGEGQFVELGHFDKDFAKSTRKRSPVGS